MENKYQIVDIDTWKRKEEYLFFKTFRNPLVGITSEVDCAKAWENAKRWNIPVSLYYLHAALVAVNEIEEFRYRQVEGQVRLYERLDLFTPVLTPSENYRSVAIPYQKDWEGFIAQAHPVVERAKRGEGHAHGDGESRQDLVLISVNPWYRFTGIQLSDPADPHESIPIFTFGKITPEGEKRLMPVSLRVNHGFVDGFRIGRFLEKFQQLLNRDTKNIKG